MVLAKSEDRSQPLSAAPLAQRTRVKRVVLQHAVASEGGSTRWQKTPALPPDVCASVGFSAIFLRRSRSTFIAAEAGTRSPQRVGGIRTVAILEITVVETTESDEDATSGAASALTLGVGVGVTLAKD